MSTEPAERVAGGIRIMPWDHFLSALQAGQIITLTTVPLAGSAKRRSEIDPFAAQNLTHPRRFRVRPTLLPDSSLKMPAKGRAGCDCRPLIGG